MDLLFRKNYFLRSITYSYNWSSRCIGIKSLLLGVICLAYSLSILGQNQSSVENFAQTIGDINRRLDQGDKLAIRDLALVWKQQPLDRGLRGLAKRYLLVTPSEFEWTEETSPASLLHFFYDKEAHLLFSDFLKVFYLTPIEQRPVKTIIKEKGFVKIAPFLLKISRENIAYALHKKNTKVLQEALKSLYKFDNPTTVTILKEVALDSDLYRLKPIEKRLDILTKVLEHLPDSMAIKILFKLGDKKRVSPIFCQNILTKTLNYRFNNKTISGLKKEWSALKTEFNNNYEAIKMAGYQQFVNPQKIFFEEAVDYYAWIAATNFVDSSSWIQHNALEDMLATKHPKALFYLAGLQFRAWKTGKNNRFLSQLEQITDVRIAIEDQSETMVTTYTDPTAELNFLIYWSQHYSDYEWEESGKGIFSNVLQKSEIIDSYEKYFRRLNSSNDSAALEAFYILTEGLPKEIQQLMKKYRPLLRTYNTSLPPLKFNIIENISQLTHFCKQNGLVYQPTLKVKKRLLQLSGNLSPKERYELENILIATLHLEELTSLEYWAAMNAQNMSLNFSIGRILDRLYTQYWARIIEDAQEFRFYLLKSHVFRQLTSFGIARLYHEKAADNQEEIQYLLQEIALIEQNELIREALKLWQYGESKETKAGISVQELLKDPSAFDKANINKLPKFSQRELADFFFTLKGVRNRQALKKMAQYLGTYASIDIVPDLFSTPLKNWEANPSAAKVIVKILEAIYGYSFSKNTAISLEKWYALWDAEKEVYAGWGKTLFELQLEELRTKDKLIINNINTVTRSAYYQPIHREICLNALKKVKKSRSISQLSIEPLICVKKELHYLEDISFSYRELDNLPKILNIEDPMRLLNYILVQTEGFNIDQKGYLVNNLLRQDWLFQLIDGKKLSAANRENMLESLQQYLNESEYLTEFEEQATQLNLLLLLNDHKTLLEKLMVLNDTKLENKVKVKWLNIIFARMKFDEIAAVFPALSTIEDFDEHTLYGFISRDFGLPIFDLEEAVSNTKLQELLKTQSERAVYEYYLTEFGIDYKDKNGKLNFQKIYELLKYDLIIPFVGEGGQYRDYYVYAIIKVLELHFKTTLDFSPKLNEYQTFFQFNSFARVKAWKQYLIDHKHVKVGKNKIPSFNEDF